MSILLTVLLLSIVAMLVVVYRNYKVYNVKNLFIESFYATPFLKTVFLDPTVKVVNGRTVSISGTANVTVLDVDGVVTKTFRVDDVELESEVPLSVVSHAVDGRFTSITIHSSFGSLCNVDTVFDDGFAISLALV